jgi:hypothetical protein
MHMEPVGAHPVCDWPAHDAPKNHRALGALLPQNVDLLIDEGM